MTRSKINLWVLLRLNGERLHGIFVLQVNDSLSIGTKDFMDEELAASENSKTKPRTIIYKKPVQFIVVHLNRADTLINIRQPEKLRNYLILIIKLILTANLLSHDTLAYAPAQTFAYKYN